jgi:RNA polymerase sigma-70 factor (ECF subfamily)
MKDRSSRQDDSGFTMFYSQYWQRLIVALTAVLPAEEDPADVAQEAFARAYQHWEHVSRLDRPDGWLFVTAYREASSIRRRIRVRRGTHPLGATPMPDSPAAELSLAYLLVGVPERQRAALLLHYHYGLRVSEIARCLRCTQGTVKSLLHRGRATLREMIEEETSA